MRKKISQYFNIFKPTIDDDLGVLISTIRIRYEDKIWDKLRESKYLNNKFYLELSHNDPYSIYHLNIKSYIKELFPDIYDFIKGVVFHDNMINLDDDCFIVCLATLNDYRKIDEKLDNELSFLEYINSEKSEMDKNRHITPEILIDAGFEFLENESNLGREAYKTNCELCCEDYSVYRKLTDDNIPIKLDIDNGQNNRGTKWHLHIDNSDCETIGCADIDTIWEFNTLMQVFKSKFRL